MLFNSFAFLCFLPCFFVGYWFLFNKSTKKQNLFLLAGSYFFYGFWDYRFLSLIILSTIIDFYIGRKIYLESIAKKRKWLLYVSLFSNLGILGIFKYFNFFIDTWIDLMSLVGYETDNYWSLSIILPVGISFYTFQTMSYTIDIHNNKIKPAKNFIHFATFVAFFPQLVAGPIERASTLLPQILAKREFNYEKAVQGLRLILWGMTKKVLVADSLSPTVDMVFQNPEGYGSLTLILVAFYFSIQIYCDFSGYSDIAIGTAKLLGLELMSNFNYPYFSRNIGEFWRRWHISLSTWFRDYVYIPLGGSRHGKIQSLKNIFIIFLLSGLWHGANWTFVFWGGFHALLYLPNFLFNTNRKYLTDSIAGTTILPSVKETAQVLLTFTMVTLAWIFFRSESLHQALTYFENLFSLKNGVIYGKRLLIYPVMLFIFDYMFRNDERLPLNFQYKSIRYTIYIIFIILIILYFNTAPAQFIYFNF